MEDGRCKLGLAGRLRLVRLIEGGARCARRRLRVPFRRPPRIVGGIAGRRPATPSGRRGRALRARPPVPRSCPWRLGADAEQRILARGSAPTTGRPDWRGWSGIAARRSGRCSPVTASRGGGARRATVLSRAMSGPSPARCCTWTPSACSAFTSGALGDRRPHEIARNRGAGYVYAHCVVDDHCRLAYVELHGADTGAAAAYARRAAAWMREQGAGPPRR